MKLKIIKIGNTKVLKLSSTLIEKYNIKDNVEILLEKDYFIVRPVSNPRKNWETAFEKMSKNGDDELLIDDVFNNENFKEWK